MDYRYYCCCVNWPRADVEDGLIPMIDDAITITRRTLLRHVNRADLLMLEDGLQYDRHPKQGLTMAADWAVSYHRSKLHGKRVYYFAHSGIEHVFVRA